VSENKTVLNLQFPLFLFARAPQLWKKSPKRALRPRLSIRNDAQLHLCSACELNIVSAGSDKETRRCAVAG
jgi:hypothetical protein